MAVDNDTKQNVYNLHSFDYLVPTVYKQGSARNMLNLCAADHNL